jgi:hypothetical protein
MLMMLGAMFTPWYFSGVALYQGDTDQCARVNLVAWQQSYCDVKGAACSNADVKKHMSTLLCPEDTAWRDVCEGKCEAQSKVYDTAGALTGLSMILSFVVGFGFCLRCVCSEHRKNNLITLAAALGAFFSLRCRLLLRLRTAQGGAHGLVQRGSDEKHRA